MVHALTSLRVRQLCALALAVALAAGRLDALTLVDLLGDAKMTPRRFASNFEGFEYEFHPGVQPPDVFLSTRRGDCDDYAILADYVLTRRDYGTRLVRVSLVGRVAHDVCYVIQSKAYLDYNNRNYASTLEGSGIVPVVVVEVGLALDDVAHVVGNAAHEGDTHQPRAVILSLQHIVGEDRVVVAVAAPRAEEHVRRLHPRVKLIFEALEIGRETPRGHFGIAEEIDEGQRVEPAGGQRDGERQRAEVEN